MSHEIRTPMNGILGFAELLKEPHLTDDQQQEYINVIGKSSARMLNIINDIVDISKIESGIVEVHFSEVDINRQMELVYEVLKLEAESKGINISFTTGLPDTESIISSDSEKFYSVLTNLVNNAIKYTEKGSIVFGYEKKDGYLEFYVKDTGIGIRQDRQEAVFERFIQADIENIMARQGSGLGLAISRAYVDMLAGKIWLESEKGIGSTFYFTLPYHTKTEKKPRIKNAVPAKASEYHFEKLKMLIVEDDEASEKFITIAVEMLSKEILNVRTGLEAVETCRNNPDIDLVLMDIQIPGLNGYEATRQIRQFNKDVVIIAQTAFGMMGDREKALKAGCNDYIAKPIKKDELIVIIQKHFKERK
jgi:CheY-like chemotaxis protein